MNINMIGEPKTTMSLMGRFPRKYQFKTDRQYRLALRKWRSENSARIKEAERQCPKF